MSLSFILISLSLLLDQLLGEPKRYHPLVGFGNCANYLESKLNTNPTARSAFTLGLLCVVILVLPLSTLVFIITSLLDSYGFLFALLILYLTIGLKSLLQHSSQVAQALNDDNDADTSHVKLERARHLTSRMVSRDTAMMNEDEMTRATIESTLENGCDSTFAVIFWFAVGGAPMAIFYRLVNTLDAMWGYRTQRYELFGKSAAKLDDILNYIPARLTALSYAICGDAREALKSWREHAKKLSSPNGGPVMTSGAGSLNIKLGGPASYHGEVIEKPVFGGQHQTDKQDISRANTLIVKAVVVWCIGLLLLSLNQFPISGLFHD